MFNVILLERVAFTDSGIFIERYLHNVYKSENQKWTRAELYERGMGTWLTVTVFFVHSNFTCMLVLTSSDGLPLLLFPIPWHACIHPHTLMYTLASHNGGCTPFLDLHHSVCRSRGPWQGLHQLWHHKCLPHLLQEDVHLVMLWNVRLKENLHQDDEGVVGW